MGSTRRLAELFQFLDLVLKVFRHQARQYLVSHNGSQTPKSVRKTPKRRQRHLGRPHGVHFADELLGVAQDGQGCQEHFLNFVAVEDEVLVDDEGVVDVGEQRVDGALEVAGRNRWEQPPRRDAGRVETDLFLGLTQGGEFERRVPVVLVSTWEAHLAAVIPKNKVEETGKNQPNKERLRTRKHS